MRNKKIKYEYMSKLQLKIILAKRGKNNKCRINWRCSDDTKKGDSKLDEFKNIQKVKIINDDQGKYTGQFATIIDAEEHVLGVDLRIATQDGGEFWVSSDSVEAYSKEV